MVFNPKFKIPNALELLKSLKTIRSDWKLKTPFQKWCYFYGIGKAPYAICRVSLLNDVHNPHWFGYFLLVYESVVPLLSLYTIFCWASEGDTIMGLPSTCVASLFIGHLPISWKIIMEDRYDLQLLIDCGGRYFYNDNHEKTKYNRICSNHMDATIRSYFIKMFIMVLSWLISSFELVYAFYQGKRLTLTELRFPFTELHSDAEFIGNIILQAIIFSHGPIMYFALENFLSTLENAVIIAPHLINSELEHVIKLWKEKEISELELNIRIKNVVEQCQDADNFVGNLSKIFFWRNLFTPVAFTYMIAMSIFCQYALQYAAGYGLATISWTQLFFVCELGEKCRDDKSADMLYETEWEDLPTKIQKCIMPLIHRKQNQTAFSLGPLGVGLSREFFKLMTNKIYTLVMFLSNFFN